MLMFQQGGKEGGGVSQSQMNLFFLISRFTLLFYGISQMTIYFDSTAHKTFLDLSGIQSEISQKSCFPQWLHFQLSTMEIFMFNFNFNFKFMVIAFLQHHFIYNVIAVPPSTFYTCECNFKPFS